MNSIPPFHPPSLIKGPHAQTMAAFFTRRLSSGRGITFKRTRLDTADGDFVDIDFPIVPGYRWLWTELGETSPLVLVLHGLEGSARGSLSLEIYRQLAKQGIRSVGLNFRSCSGEMNRTHVLYHSGATDDVTFLLEWLNDNFPNVPKGLIGFSLGGNVTLKYMGENSRFVDTAVAISPPFDLGLGSSIMETTGPFYMTKILQSLKSKARKNRHLYEQFVDVDAALSAKTFREFDDAWQPINGFKDGQDYYDKSSSKNFIGNITKPTLILRSKDDPFFDPTDIPYDLLQNPALTTILTEHGGHGGFVESVSLLQPQFWAERVGAQFLANHLCKQKAVA